METYWMYPAAIALVFFFVVLLGSSRQGRSANVPADLSEATLFMAEQNISCQRPIALHCRPDQVFKGAGGMLYVVDIKSHARAYPADILQISVAAFILSTMGHKVSSKGYVRSVHNGIESYLPVNLYSQDEIIRLYQKYHALINGSISPSGAQHPALCKTCSYRSECSKAR
jgi:CRISPR/Cas system-associated exonuclease Cas4 (RecB family)